MLLALLLYFIADFIRETEGMIEKLLEYGLQSVLLIKEEGH
jgi:hypothetical protein